MEVRPVEIGKSIKMTDFSDISMIILIQLFMKLVNSAKILQYFQVLKQYLNCRKLAKYLSISLKIIQLYK